MGIPVVFRVSTFLVHAKGIVVLYYFEIPCQCISLDKNYVQYDQSFCELLQTLNSVKLVLNFFKTLRPWL